VTCTHCGSQLEIHRSGGAAFTKVLEQLDQRTARVEQDLAEIKIREQIDELDRRWESKRDQYMIHGKDGGSSEPSSGNAVGTAAMLGLSGLLALCAGGAKGSNVVLVVGAGLLIVALFFGVTVANWAREYELAKSLYQQSRDDLMQKLDQLRK
jgi:Flp pilus assembly protein TadB